MMLLRNRDIRIILKMQTIRKGLCAKREEVFEKKIMKLVKGA